eukprot:CAMPEP_0179245230 /NCGR_PEP_ID=MMETSP0797-20121207/18464_1 /TAXON_ID=47934 /ORGANISM="Dinophysis acuminata, Strain DAEP01" /LENGTH=144 /DNA_ID=CAMNT_0020952767 /DNA_START=162 /DNA_END=596 /DNA_ORIENTATION=-
MTPWPLQLVFRHHHLHKLVVVDLAVLVLVRLADELVDLLLGELLAQARQDMPQLLLADATVAVAVEDLERLGELLVGIALAPDLPSHQHEELTEFHRAVAIRIDLVDQQVELVFRGVLVQLPQDLCQLIFCDAAILRLVERIKG